MKKNIKKLLFSKVREDVLIGWELLKLPENLPKGEEWYLYFDIIRDSPSLSSWERDGMLREIVGDNYINNPLWGEWDPKPAIEI